MSRDLGLRTWDLDRVGRGRGDAGTSHIGDAGGKVGGKCDVFVKMCYLWSILDSIVPEPHRTPYNVYTNHFFI